ncbi:hypothetical protein [Xenorhabdus bovienii]|uniref:hypothetical protein n=1 Tax=Xenorhabdus bovienii TaxID=40576 RepID=UPI0023B2D815|nr:hypothetical protein [Xenorhabdus bovienii]MDE9545290.1 hypothetical protein [Xenorhabdus bovienii]
MTQTDSREAPCGGCTGRRWRARQRATERSDCEPRADNAAGLGRGRLINGGRRPTCLQGCLPQQGKAAKAEHGLPGTGSEDESRRRSLVRHTRRG